MQTNWLVSVNVAQRMEITKQKQHSVELSATH